MVKTQAERIIEKFGGARALAALLNVNPPSIYRWTYPKERLGSEGIVPTKYWPRLVALATVKGIPINVDFFDPRPLSTGNSDVGLSNVEVDPFG